MGRTWQARAGALLLCCCWYANAQAGDLRIHYAERLAVRATEPASKPAAAGGQRLVFRAFGRQFDAQLEANERVLRKLSAAQLAAIGEHAAYRGQLAGQRDSWVRLTRLGSELHGAIWDGVELFSIAPARSVRDALPAASTFADADLLIYRLSDTESVLDTGICGVGPAQLLDSAFDYPTLVRELRARLTAANVATDQIEVEFIADTEFSSLQANTAGALLARINVVDGIFVDQLGVSIAPQLRTFVDAADPFTGDADGASLLDQMGVYRESTPEVRDRGLAHLVTGRDMTVGGSANLLGIAFVAALCEPYGGVAVSEGDHDVTISSLIIAHEIGHNFGAPHDTEPGSPCESAPSGFLMEPALNMSNRFSQCSLDQMRSRIEAAACILPLEFGDATVAIPAPIRAVVGQPFEYVIEVRSQGNRTVDDVAVEISQLQILTIHSASAESGTCTMAASSVLCQLGDLDPGVARRVSIMMTSAFASATRETTARITSSNDRIAANDVVTVPIFIGSAADLSIALSPPSLSAFTRETVTFTATVTSTGPLPAINVGVGFFGGFKLRMQTAASPGARCTAEVFFAGCQLGTLAVGETRQVVFTAASSTAGSTNAEATVNAENDDVPTNDIARSPLVITATSDAQIGEAGAVNAIVGESFSLQVPLSSIGPQPVDDVEVRIFAESGPVVIESATVAGGTCAPFSTQFRCTLGSLPQGTLRTIAASVRGDQAGTGSVRFALLASNDENPANDTSSTIIRVRHVADAGVSADPFSFAELQPFTLHIPLRSLGLQAITSLAATITLPAAVTAIGASLPNGSCTVTAGSATCTLPSLAPDTIVFLDLTVHGSAAGNFLGRIAVAAGNDTNPINDAADLRFGVLPFFDAALETPLAVTGFLNEAVDVPFVVTTLNQTMTQVALRLDRMALGVIDSANWPAGSCTVANNVVDCELGTLAPGTSTTVTLRLRAVSAAFFTIRAQLSASQDVSAQNNSGMVSVRLNGRPDAGFAVGSLNVPAQPAANFTATIPLMVFGFDGVTDVLVTIPLPASIVASAATIPSGACTIAGTVTCSLPTPQGDGRAFPIDMTLRASTAGNFPTTVALTASNDANAANNSLQVVYVINPPAPPPSGGNGGGGGGGSLELILLLALLLARTVAVSRRFQP